MKASTKYVPFEASHPGSLILDEIKFRGINQADLAVQMSVQKSLLNEIIKGKRALTADIALLLEKILEIPAQYWMNLQSQFELDLARINEKNIKKLANVEKWSIINQYVPISYLKKQNYIQDDINDNIEKIKSIYSVDSIDQLVQKNAQQHFAFYRKSEKLIVEDKNMLAWNMLAQFEAKNQTINSFNYSNVPSLIEELKQIFFENSNTIEKVKTKLNQYGVKFILLEKIEKAPIDGYTFWSGDNPAIAMTVRHKRIDNFAFTLMHEIGHIDLHLKNDKNIQFFDLTTKSTTAVEVEADDYAQRNLITPLEWQSIINLPEINDYSLNLKANEFKINPAIILGRISHDANYYRISTTIDKLLK